MSATLDVSLGQSKSGTFLMAVIAGLACAFLVGKALPSTMDAISTIIVAVTAIVILAAWRIGARREQRARPTG